MENAFICDAIRTPIGRYAGTLSSVRPDDLAAHVIKTLVDRNPDMDAAQIEDVYFGCANQSGEDCRNVGRMAVLLSGLPHTVPANTINRLCGSGMDAVIQAGRTIALGDADLLMAGGVESMSRAPFVMPKAPSPFARQAEIYDTTIGTRFLNKKMAAAYGNDSMPETAENLIADMGISREAQDEYAYRSQQRAKRAQDQGHLAEEIVAVSVPQRKKDPIIFEHDEHMRPTTTLEALAKLPTPFREGGTVTAGNASGTNDGAAAMIMASNTGVKAHGLTPRARIVSAATSGVMPRIMGIGPVTATQKALTKAGLSLGEIGVIELNEAFAGQALACMRELGLADDSDLVNPNGGAIALGHPLGMSGARIVNAAIHEMKRRDARYALATMCIGMGQGIAVILENV